MTPPRPHRHPTDRPGLQGERTELAWERSALGLFAAAALLLFHRVGPTADRVVLAALDVGLGLLMIWFGRRRGRRIRALRAQADGRTTVPDAGPELLVAAAAATVLAAGTAFVLVLRT